MYRQGRDPGVLLQMFSSKELQLFSSSTIEWNHVSARIHEGRFLLRYHTLATPAAKTAKKSQIFWRRKICPHMEISVQRDEYYVWHAREQCRHTRKRPNPAEKAENDAFWKCQFCLTEVQFGYNNSHDRRKGISAVCTVWKDLGEGRSYFDLEWQSHLDLTTNGDPYTQLIKGWTLIEEGRIYLDLQLLGHVDHTIDGEPNTQHREPIEFELGSIRSSFEQGRVFKHDSLISSAEACDMMKVRNALRSRSRFVIRPALSKFFNREEIVTSPKSRYEVKRILSNYFGGNQEKRPITKRKDVYIGCNEPSRLYHLESKYYDSYWLGLFH
ncbi:hypothetical protein F5884DRAFT_857003 [Xylogone sp. PMI_703]|nr:hypothetical protein F5884DRAFT_857003 [Xylogone sp. PMI_703]